METILEWHSPEHYFNKKDRDWYWILGIVTLGASVLAFYFDNFLFGVFILIAGLTVGILSYKETETVSVKLTNLGVVFGNHLYPWERLSAFWIEDDHFHGPRVLFHPLNSLLPLISIPVNTEVALDEIRDLLLEFLEEEYLRESIIHRWFDKILAK